MPRRIMLTQGYSCIVDDADYEFLSQWSWHVLIGSHVYAVRNSEPVNGKRRHILMHRVLCNTPDGMDTDHINGNSLDNRRANLRVATRNQNMHNRKPNAKGSSKYKGVSWHKQHRKWIVNIQVNKVKHFLGLFTDEKEAAMAYERRAKEEFGEFHRSNIK